MAGDKMKDLFEAIIENVIKVHNLKPYKELENDVKRDVIHRSIFIYKLGCKAWQYLLFLYSSSTSR